MLTRIRTVWTILACLLLVVTGCTETEGDTEAATAQTEAVAVEAGASASAVPDPISPTRVEITTPDEAAAGTIDFEGDAVRIELPGQEPRVLVGRRTAADKRKYFLEEGGQVAEVKFKDDGFKVRTPDSRLLWKIKHYADKLKISDNEENLNPYELRYKPDDRVKVERAERELGKVNFYRDRGKVKVKTADGTERFETNTTAYSGAYGVLLIDEIGEVERYIIVAEMLSRGW